MCDQNGKTQYLMEILKGDQWKNCCAWTEKFLDFEAKLNTRNFLHKDEEPIVTQKKTIDEKKSTVDLNLSLNQATPIHRMIYFLWEYVISIQKVAFGDQELDELKQREKNKQNIDLDQTKNDEDVDDNVLEFEDKEKKEKEINKC